MAEKFVKAVAKPSRPDMNPIRLTSLTVSLLTVLVFESPIYTLL